ncbi:MAG: hypothetical protein HETSPECPRED_003977 [Heterodermia speciosa]|uniref:Uncharacterized protein n=1 Tax=Heterodermia speciosa TaxID=116794 RepID=A0A8H3F766_9LECA|nr:MAG: hypothetical protein HETSPECPRED_003977 [Heterodermia speciosa]
MIAFDADELSTIAGDGWLDESDTTRIRPFNLADLPCPPQSIMEENWYKPALGEPYIPRLAFPSKLLALDPLWSKCKPAGFTGWDPPRTLVAVSAMDPDTTIDPHSTTGAPDPQESGSAASPTPAPVQTPVLDQPKPTATPKTNPGNTHGYSSLHLPVPTQGSSPEDDTSTNGKPVDVPSNAHPETIQPSSHGDNSGNGADPGGTDPTDGSGKPSTITSIAGNAATHLPGIIVIGSTTLAGGDPPVTISGTVVSHISTALVAASKTLPLPTKPAIITSIAGIPATFVPNAVAIAGTTLTPGGSPLSLPGTIVTLGSSAILVVPTPLPLPQSQQDVRDIAGTGATLQPDAVIIAGTTLRPGDPPFSLSGFAISVDSSLLKMGTKTVPLPQSRHGISQNADVAVTAVGGLDQGGGITLGETFTYETPISLASNGDLIMGEATLKRGGVAASIDGTLMSLMSNGNLVLDDTTLSPGGAAITMHGTAVSVAADGSMVVDGTTLEPGGSGITMGGTSIFPSFHGALVVDGTTLKTGASGVTMDGISISLLPDHRLILDGTTLTPGGAAVTFHGTSVSLMPNGKPVFDGTTLISGGADITIAGMPVSLAPGGDLVLDGTTLRPGAAGITVAGTPLSFAPDGNIVIDGTTLKPGAIATTIHNIPISIAPNGYPVFDGTTLTPGGARVTIAGMVLSVASDGNMVVDGTTIRPGNAYQTAHGLPISIAPNENPVFDGTTLTPGGVAMTMNGISVSLASDGNLVIGGTTLTPGGAGVTVNGASISVASDDHIAVTTSKDSIDNLGSLIIGGFWNGPSRTSSASPSTSIDIVAFEGTAATSKPGLIYGSILLMGIVLVFLF